MKVLHVNSYYYNSEFYKNLYDKQVENGLDIDVYVPKTISCHSRNFEYGDYTTVSNVYKKYERIFFHLKHNKIFKDIDKKYNIKNFSLVHAHSLFSNGYIANKLKQKYNLPYIVAVRDTDINLFFRKIPYLRNLGIQILNNAQFVVFLSRSYQDQLIEKYVPDKLKKSIIDKSRIVPNGIDDYWLENINDKKNISSSTSQNIRLLYVGKINKRKNIETTVNAIKILRENDYNINFTIVGNIQDEKIFKKIKKLPYLNYIPPRTKEDLLEIYRKNDIFVMPSLTETFGLVYAEAMSQGIPIIYSDGQGFSNQFKEGEVGYGVEATSEDDIVKKIQKILINYNEISNNCIIKVNKFNWQTIQKTYNSLYSKMSN